MASLQQRLPENVPGDFFVDSTCIDCDTCSQLAPGIFRDHGDQCSVYHQPETTPKQTRDDGPRRLPDRIDRFASSDTTRISASTRFRSCSTRMFTFAALRRSRALARGVI